ncbi:MAG: deoxyribodipyrimidine photo-lyase, partial [Burkholderiaceae bacterium]
MSGTALYWFRNDLRLHDAPALWAAAASAPCRFVWKATLSLGHRRRERTGRQV